MKIYLDDVRDCPEGWTLARSAESLITSLQLDLMMWRVGVDPSISEISLDHDLGENRLSGYDVVCYLEKIAFTDGFPTPTLKIHSANPVGRKNMQVVIDKLNDLR